MKRSQIFFNALKVPADFLAAAGAFFVAKSIRLNASFLDGLQSPASIFKFENFEIFTFVAAAVLVAIFALNGMYRMRRTRSPGRDARRVVFLVSAWLLLIVAFFFFRREFFFSRLALAYAWLLTIVFVLVGRGLVALVKKFFQSRGVGVRQILLVGKNLELKNFFAHRLEFALAGELPSVDLPKIKKMVAAKSIDEIVFADRNLSHENAEKLLNFCRTNHVAFSFVPDTLDAPRKNIDIDFVRGVPLVSLRASPLTGWGRIAKRIFDLVVGFVALVLTSPIWLVAAVAIRIDSPGPIFFTRKDDGSPVLRVGRGGRQFVFVKFRSMRANTDSLRYSAELAKKNTRAGTPLVKIENDPRITRVGKFIRKYSIDELPQILSVLKGDMSLVGPRPHLPEEVAKYREEDLRVLEIKPGVTGLSQVSGRSDLSFEREMELEKFYIENWSVWLDLKILFRTVGVVLFPSHKE